MSKTEFTGLDGSNLLAYLAALGTLRVLTISDPRTDVRMEWVDRGSRTPILHHPAAGSAEEILKLLGPLVCGEGTINPAWEIGNDLTLPCEKFGEVLSESLKKFGAPKRSTLDFLAAFGAEVYWHRSQKRPDVRYGIPHDERRGTSALFGIHERTGIGHSARPFVANAV